MGLLKQSYAALCLAALSLTAASCGNDDKDNLKLGFKNPSDSFRPADGDTTRTAQLRRDFYNETGIYLLFTDTLQHEYVGNDINGDPQYFTEKLDITYNVGQTHSNEASYTYVYIDKYDDRQKIADFARDYLLNHITGRLRPYSIFCSRIITGVNNRGTTIRPVALTNQRCIVIAGSYLLSRNRTDAEKKNYAQSLINSIISQLAQNSINEFSSFFNYSSRYYGASYGQLGIDGTEEELKAYGFVGTPALSNCPSQSDDLGLYASMAVRYTTEEIESKYADYPIIINKFKALRQILCDLGYVF